MTGMGDGTGKISEVWHVRHGERCDEVSGAERRAWEQSPRYKIGGWFDTFLTCHGHVQASSAGTYLKGLPFNEQPGRFDVVYTSPLVRAVQTAVCVSQALGNLPLQVVPGLASCTAALTRIGYASAHDMLMTDADIAAAFPWVTVVPRDPLAPTSFSEAATWLAAKACEKAEGEGTAGGDSDSDRGGSRVSRVLVVGHREGTKAMASSDKVPTPYCCIGIFRAEASGEAYSYELHDLLSHKGVSIKPGGVASSYSRPTVSTTPVEDNGSENDDNSSAAGGEDGYHDSVKVLAARVIAQTVSTGKGDTPMF